MMPKLPCVRLNHVRHEVILQHDCDWALGRVDVLLRNSETKEIVRVLGLDPKNHENFIDICPYGPIKGLQYLAVERSFFYAEYKNQKELLRFSISRFKPQG